ncbi:MAG TPA: protease modulator HflC [Devosiaceae bacterium]|jgi:membrane protease subunit HflC|nr:protease modulator HflC [Devosiaceae bacterium]
MNRLIILGVVLVGALYILFSSIYVVNEREQAIVMRFGQITDVHTEPGLYFKVPTDIVDSVQIIEDRLLRYDIADMTLQVSGGKFYEVDAFLTYRIADPRLFRERALGELRVIEDRIGTRFDAALRQVYGLREFNAALSEERPQMMREARQLMVADMAALGIDIVDVRILRTDLTNQVSAQTYERMQAERLAEAALLRARGQEVAQSLRAVADRQAVEIIAAAQRDAEILRGEGDAQRSLIFAEAYNLDREFFDFYRSMESYRAALGSAGTTMVLTPDTEFFQYFGSDQRGGTAGGAATSAGAGEAGTGDAAAAGTADAPAPAGAAAESDQSEGPADAPAPTEAAVESDEGEAAPVEPIAAPVAAGQ